VISFLVGLMSEQRVHRSASCWCGHGGPSHFGEGSGAVVCRECDRRPLIDESQTPMLVTERRRFDRFSLPHPIRTSVGASPAYVIDASIAGIGVLQNEPAPAPGTSCRLMFHSEFGPITLQCEIARSAGDRNSGTFQTGLRIVAADDESEARLRMLVMALAVPASRPSGH
jgi:hypothetical protein